MGVYFDNAATTRLDPKVLEAMQPYMLEYFGNPSSLHSHGRYVRTAIERARKKVAAFINASPAEIFFTSGGTEANNTALMGAVKYLGIQHIISCKLEHHAVLHPLDMLEKIGIKISYLKVDKKGVINYHQLEQLLKDHPKSLVSLMYANNEIGNLLDVDRVQALCKAHQALFHSDTVQTIGHYPLDVKSLNLDFIVGSAHKFHGPKGIGFLYVNHKHKIEPLIHGGSQERNMRGGTENTIGIMGLEKALEMALENLKKDQLHIEMLKHNLIERIRTDIPESCFMGLSDDLNKSLYTILNVGLPFVKDNDMLLFNLDIEEVSVSGGSACTSGSHTGSHVLQAIGYEPNQGAVRISFCKYNTLEEIDYLVNKLKKICFS